MFQLCRISGSNFTEGGCNTPPVLYQQQKPSAFRVKKLAVKFKGNEILGVGEFDVFACYRDLWKTELEKQNAVRQDIIHSSGCTKNCMKLQMNALDKNALGK